MGEATNIRKLVHTLAVEVETNKRYHCYVQRSTAQYQTVK